jgi:uncharacterized protein (UPF0264 family)
MSKRKAKAVVTKLLVSVSSQAEALTAAENGADLIDVKNPLRGSLGAATPDVWRHVLAAVGEKFPVSAALGELRDDDVIELAQQTAGLSFAKIGLNGCTAPPDYDWRTEWSNWRSFLPEGVAPVMVAYADWGDCGAPSPMDLLKCVKPQRVPIVLVDTYDKSNGTLRDHCSNEQLARFIADVRKLKAKIVLAGSLRLVDVIDLLPLAPDYFAVRGAVCRGSREGRLDGALVREWSQALSTSQ